MFAVNLPNMPRLKKRVNSGDYYVHHSFRNNHLLIRVTYQITPGGENRLLDAGLRDDDSIPVDLFRSLMDDGDLYTGESGPAVEVDVDRPGNQATNRNASLQSTSRTSREAPVARPAGTALPTNHSPELSYPDGRLLGFRDFCARYSHHDRKSVSKAYDKVRRSFYKQMYPNLKRLLCDRKIYRVEEIGPTVILHCAFKNGVATNSTRLGA